MPLMTATDITEFMQRTFPSSRPERFRIESVDERSLTFRYSTTEDDLRPGGTVSGPTLMTLSDVGMLYAVLASVGPITLTMTTNLNIHFLNKPTAGDLIVETKILKLGKRLAVGEVLVHGAGVRDPVSHATVTYSIPADR